MSEKQERADKVRDKLCQRDALHSKTSLILFMSDIIVFSFLLTDYIDSFPYSLARKMRVLPNGSEKMNIHNVGSLQWQREHKSLKLGGKPIIRSARISAR